MSDIFMVLMVHFRILKECDVQLYRQMGSVRDDMNIHEKALDILIELMKKEQVRAELEWGGCCVRVPLKEVADKG